LDNNTNEVKTKVCTKCKREFPETNYYFRKDKKGKNGWGSQCKDCLGYGHGVRRNKYMVDRSKTKKGFKICTVCTAERDINDFGNDNRNKDGKKSRCRKCESKITSKWKRERKYEYDPVYFKEWHRKNPDYRRKIYERNKEIEKANNKRWRNNNKDKVKLKVNRRRQLEKNLPYNYSEPDWRQTLKYFSNSCCYCGTKGDLEQDHFIPLAKGGAFIKSNIVPACRHCNSSKKDKLFEEWYPSKEYYNASREERIYKFIGVKNNIQQLSIL